MRIFSNLYEMAKEVQRDLHEMGIRVELKTFQNKNIEFDDSRRITKELQGYTFKILHPLQPEPLDKAYRLVYGENAQTHLNWALQEFIERITIPEAVFLTKNACINPGEAWKIRKDTWLPFLDDEGKFEYTYNERFMFQNQLYRVIEHLKKDINSRRAVISIWQTEEDLIGLEKLRRVPCSVTYSFLYREGKLGIFYHMRSSDFYEHFLNDMYLASKMNEFVASLLDVRAGETTAYINSLHAYKKNLDERGIF